jgi:hypothetical protein
MSSAWSIYEDAARKVLADTRQVLGIATVEGKQSLAGASGTNWELDAKAWREGSDGFLVIEVRRRISAGLKQILRQSHIEFRTSVAPGVS